MSKNLVIKLAAVFLICGCSAKTSQKAPQPITTKQEANSPDARAFAAAFKKANAANSNHKILKTLAGNWDAEIKIWSEPDTEPTLHQGSETNSVEFEGLFLRQEFTGLINNRAISTLTFLGYDNFRRAFTSFTIESGSTQLVMNRGSIDKSGKILTFSAVTTDPISLLPYRIKSIMTLSSDSQRKLEVFETYPNGDILKTTEILFTKRPS